MKCDLIHGIWDMADAFFLDQANPRAQQASPKLGMLFIIEIFPAKNLNHSKHFRTSYGNITPTEISPSYGTSQRVKRIKSRKKNNEN